MKTSAQPRLAIIGCGAVVQTHLVPALRRIGWLPQVLAEPSQNNLEATVKLVGKSSVQAAVADWRQAADRFDAAIVAAPHVYHGEIGAALAAAGKHVFMEKPLATTTDGCRAILDTAQRSGAIVSVGLLRRYLHAARWTAELVRSGTLGTIKHFEAKEGFVFNRAVSTDALLSPQASGGGVLIDTGAHTFDLIRWWLGEIGSVTYWDDNQGGVEAECVIDCELASGGTGHIELSRSRDLPNTCRIEGTKGFVEVHLYKNEVIACSPEVRSFRVGGHGVGAFPEQRFPELFSTELADFRSSIVEGKHKGVSGEDGVQSVSFIERCYAVRQRLTMPWSQPATSALPTPSLSHDTQVAITGASGFIGGRLVERLLEQGVKVRCLVRGAASAVRLARLPVEIRRVDLADAAAVSAAVEGCDFVFHCAYDPRLMVQNQAAVQNLVDASLTHKVERLVHVSTFSIYEPFPNGDLTEETPDGNRSWVYTRIKLDLENQVFNAVRNKGLRATIVQPTIVYGPFSRPWTIGPATMLLYGTVLLPDRGEGICNALHVDDLVDAMLLAAVKEEAIGQRFLVSGPDTVTWSHFFEQFARALGTKGPQYRAAKEISRQNSGIIHDVKMVASNPKMLIQIAARSRAIRNLAQKALDSLPKPLYDRVSGLYFGSGERPHGRVHLPDPQGLRLYMAKPVARLDKARRLLGYQPRIDFATGMQSTALYLNWAYGHERPKLVVAEPQQPRAVSLAQAGSVGDAD